jgi:Matrixin/Divergent InlB B-repeat domain
MRNTLSCLVLFATLATSRAFDYIGTPPIRWFTSEVPMVLQLDDTGPAASFSWDAVAVQAMNAWNSVVSGIELVPDSGSGHFDGNDRNEVFFSDSIYGHRFGSGVLAITTIWRRGSERVEGDTVFNSDIEWGVYHGDLHEDDNELDFRRVATHEFGHTFGLDHPDAAGEVVPALMNSRVSDLDSLTADDIAGIQGLYAPGGTLFNLNVIINPPGAGTYVVTPSSPDGKYSPGTPLKVTCKPNKGYRFNYWEGYEPVKGRKVKMNIYSDTTLIANFVTTGSPRVSSAPQSQFTSTGYDLYLRVKASAGLGGTYQWQHDGVDLDGETQPFLLLFNLQHADAGMYSVTVRNDHGETSSKPARVVVSGY